MKIADEYFENLLQMKLFNLLKEAVEGADNLFEKDYIIFLDENKSIQFEYKGQKIAQITKQEFDNVESFIQWCLTEYIDDQFSEYIVKK